MQKLSVVIASWNRKDDTLQTLDSLAKSNLKGFIVRVIVVDNGSKDQSSEAVNEFIKNFKGNKHISWKLLRNKTNTGFCEGNNKGMRLALREGSDWVVLLNDDVLVDENMLAHLAEAYKSMDRAGAITPKIYFAGGYEFHKRYKKSELGRVFWYAGGDIDWDNIYGSNHGVDEVDKGQYDQVREIDFASGCCVLYPSEVLKKVGLLDKRYFAYLEDADISQRIRGAGYKVLYYPKAFMWHKVSQSSGVGSDLNDYFLTRNRMIFGMRYAKLRTKFALLRESVKLLLNGRKWQKIGVADYYQGNFEKGSWGNSK